MAFSVQSDNHFTVSQNRGTFHIEYIHLRTLGVTELISETLAKKLKYKLGKNDEL